MSCSIAAAGACVDDACVALLEMGVSDYRSVRRYLDHRPAAPLWLAQIDPLSRTLTHCLGPAQAAVDRRRGPARDRALLDAHHFEPPGRGLGQAGRRHRRGLGDADAHVRTAQLADEETDLHD